MNIIIVSCLIFSSSSLRLPTEKKLVYDVGMNTGVDTENFLKDGYRVVAIEANPFFAEGEAKKDIVKPHIKNGELKIVNIGIKNDRPSSSEGLEFWIPDSVEGNEFSLNSETISGTASFTKHNACRLTGSCHAMKIATKTCSDLMEEEGTPYYMKVDIEGQDIECVRNVMDKRCGADKLPEYVSFENYGLDTWASYYGEGGKVKELMEVMHKRGYTNWKRARQWTEVYNNTQGSGESSEFGEELQDLETTKAWKPTSDFKDKLGCDVDCDASKGYCRGYCDMHAKLDLSLASC